MISAIHDRLVQTAIEPVSLCSMAVLRMVVGVIVSWSALRFLVNDWVTQFFVKPNYMFHFWGLDWIVALPQPGMSVIFVLLALLGASIAAGLFYRVSTVGALVLWTYVELIDVTNYLNHYVLVSLLLLLLLWMPAHRLWSLDQKFWPVAEDKQWAPRWMIWLLRFQVISVYFWAGMAKFSQDWLIHAQPLNIWLMARTDLPIIGTLFNHWPVALMMSWSGFLFDSTIWLFLLHPRTRRPAYLVVIVFHLLTGLLFNIGLFPFIMIGAATILFAPDWANTQPLDHVSTCTTRPHSRPAKWVVFIVGFYILIQVLMPMRHWFYGGNVLWHEQGMRWSWRVMVREKNGSVTYRVMWAGRARALEVSPARYLTDHQVREMSGQPDMILQLGQYIGHQYSQKVGKPVAVYVDAFASLNGRPPARLIDSGVDLTQVQDSFIPATWILPMPQTSPAKLMFTPQQGDNK